MMPELINQLHSALSLLLSQEIWAKTGQQSLSPITKQLETAIFENCPILCIAS